jgi:hypothetical protein
MHGRGAWPSTARTHAHKHVCMHVLNLQSLQDGSVERGQLSQAGSGVQSLGQQASVEPSVRAYSSKDMGPAFDAALQQREEQWRMIAAAAAGGRRRVLRPWTPPSTLNATATGASPAYEVRNGTSLCGSSCASLIPRPAYLVKPAAFVSPFARSGSQVRCVLLPHPHHACAAACSRTRTMHVPPQCERVIAAGDA